MEQHILVCHIQDIPRFAVHGEFDTGKVTVKILNQFEFTLAKERVMQAERIIFVVPSGRVFFDDLPWELASAVDASDVINVVEYHKKRGILLPEEHAMNRQLNEFIKPFTITDVAFKDLDALVLEDALEKVTDKLEGISMKKAKGELYIVQDGGSFNVNGEEFRKLIRDTLVGKSLLDLSNPSYAVVVELIQKLGIVASLTLTKEKVDLFKIFGQAPVLND